MVTAALTMIAESIKEASYFATGSAPKHNLYTKKALTEAYAFIQGTGLEITLQTFELDYDADKIRSLFNGYVKQKS